MCCLSRLLYLTIKVSGVSGLHAQKFVEAVLRQGLEHAHLIPQTTKTLSPMHGHVILKIVSLYRIMKFFHQIMYQKMSSLDPTASRYLETDFLEMSYVSYF